MGAVGPEATADPVRRVELPPDGVDALDLVLERDELEALQVFHRSFNLPGLRFGLLNPVCDEDYYPPDHEEEEDPVATAAKIPSQTEDLIRAANALLIGDDAPGIEEEIQVVEPALPMNAGSRPHSRTIRTRAPPSREGRR